MNYDLIYTLALGNRRSIFCILTLQSALYLLTIDMFHPLRGLFIAIFMSLLISSIASLIIIYYNSSFGGIEALKIYVKNIEDKKRIFRRSIVGSYLMSLTIISFLYFLDLGIADYFIYTAPTSLIILLIAIFIHDDAITNKYNTLKRQTWVFDYKKTPIIKSIKNNKETSVPIFDSHNRLLIGEDNQDMKLENIFKEIPPGSKLVNKEFSKPSFKIVDFREVFEYTNIGAFKEIYLKHSNKEEEKIYDLYIDTLSKYSGLYDIEYSSIDCLKSTININNEEVKAYILKNDYVSRFVNYKDENLRLISLRMREEFINMSIKKFVLKFARLVEDYEIKVIEGSIFVFENINNNIFERDISYLQKYMSLNLEEYYPEKKAPVRTKEKENYHSVEEKFDSRPNIIKKKERAKFKKTLYQINLKGELIYFFLEDIKNLAELDELIVKNFVNRDILLMLKKAKNF